MVHGGFWVAAEGRQRTPGGGITGGAGAISPAGVLHAVDPSTSRVLCGEPLRALVPFQSLLWSGLKTGVRCRECVRIATES